MSPSYPVAVQLYSLRERSSEDFAAVLEEVAAMGYDGVEPFNLYGMSPRAFRTRLDELGLRLASSHYPWANRTDSSELIDALGELNLHRAIGGFGSDDFKTPSAIARTIEQTQQLSEQLATAGISLCLHNHWWEYELDQDEPAYYALQRAVPNVEFELDTYWAANFGARDPVAELSRIADRTPLLHIKDGPLVADAAHTAVGDGVMPVTELIAAANPNRLEWLIVELDTCATDVSAAVAKSLAFLRGTGVAPV
ncbi:MAG: sugar phosphate isomerase/epimerase family protein [Pseudomonadales bacterium]